MTLEGAAVAVDAESKSERAYGWLRERIAARDFSPGYRLVLAPLAAELGMSVVPVREAIRRLEAEGLVTFERNVGARVTLVDAEEYMHTMQTLGLVEGLATALSAPLLTRADLDRALAVNDRMTTLLDHFDPHAFTELNREFHAILYAPCPNPHILDLVGRGWSRLSSLRDTIFGFVPGRAQHSVAEHTQLVDLIARGADPLEIELAARRHRWSTMTAFLATRTPPASVPPVTHPTEDRS